MPLIYNHTHTSFKNEFKKLKKKYPSLESDLNTLKKVVMNPYHLENLSTPALKEIPGLGKEQLKAYKVVRFACKSLKGQGSKTGIRFTYIINLTNNEITFIEMYLKSNKAKEDKERIKKFIKSLGE